MEKIIKFSMDNSWLLGIVLIIVGIYLLYYWISNKEVRDSYKRRSEDNLIELKLFFNSYMARNYSIIFLISVICILYGTITLLIEFNIVK